MTPSTEPLFLEAPVLEKTAGLELSNDPTAWQTEIIVHVHEHLPYVAQYQLGVKLQKVDDKTGYGYGFLTVGNQGQSSVHVPLIIQEWELHPLDVFILNEEFFPLTESRLESVMFDPRMFSGSVSPEEGTGGYAQNYPPHSGKYVYASARPSGSVLDAIAPTITSEDKKYFLDKLAGDEWLRTAVREYGLAPMVQKVARSGRPTLEPGAKLVHKVLRPNVVQIEKVGYDRFAVRAVSDRLYCPVEKIASGDEVIEKFGQDTLTHVLENGEYSTVQGERPVQPVVIEGLSSELKKLTAYGRCEVRTALNDRVVGWLFPKVVGFDGVPLKAEKLFTNGVDIWSMQPDIAGVEIVDSLKTADSPPSRCLDIGVTGIFYQLGADGEAFCTIPFTIISAPVDLGDFMRLEVRTELGEGLVFEISNGVLAISPSRRNRQTRIIPASMRFCAVGKCQRLQDDPETVVKYAQENLKERSYIQVSSLNDGQTFSLAGTVAETLEGGGSNVPRTRAKFHLMSLGMSPSSAELALDKAARNGRVTVANLQPLLLEHEKEAELRRSLIEPLVESLPSLKTDLIKEAVMIGDADTVDSVLALNFINLENISTFMEYLPQLKEAASKLAQLLVASRLGFGTVPTEAAKKAMDNLERVIMNLEHLASAAQSNGQI